MLKVFRRIRGAAAVARTLGVAIWLSFVTSSALASDVAVASLVRGEVMVEGPGEPPAKLAAYSKLFAGDVVQVPAGGQVRAVYLSSGRQETWRGPARFRAALPMSEVLAGMPEVVQVPSAVPQKLARIPELVQIARASNSRAGAVTLRSAASSSAAEAQREQALADARKTYAAMQADTAKDDITPELYLYATYQDYAMYPAMRSLTEVMLTKQPDNPQAKALAAWLEARSQ